MDLTHVTLQVLDLCYCSEIFTLFEYELMRDKKQALVHKRCFSPTAGTPSVSVHMKLAH